MKATVYEVKLIGPQDIVVGEQFGLTITLSPSVEANATISKISGTDYNEIGRTEKYWNADGDLCTTETYIHQFGIKLPSQTTVKFTGTYTFNVTQFTLEPFTLRVIVDAFGGITKDYTASKEHVWAKVKATYFRTTYEDESHDWPGYFYNNLPRTALSYGTPSLINTNVVLTEDTSSETKIEAKVRDRGPWFPFGRYYPKDTDWYNDYWDDAGWKPLAVFMYGLIRAEDTNYYVINGASIDLSEGAIKGLKGKEYNPNNWPNPQIYWRFK